jgi:hypothetical protein
VAWEINGKVTVKSLQTGATSLRLLCTSIILQPLTLMLSTLRKKLGVRSQLISMENMANRSIGLIYKEKQHQLPLVPQEALEVLAHLIAPGIWKIKAFAPMPWHLPDTLIWMADEYLKHMAVGEIGSLTGISQHFAIFEVNATTINYTRAAPDLDYPSITKLVVPIKYANLRWLQQQKLKMSGKWLEDMNCLSE